MAARVDLWGNPVTVASAAAVDHYNNAILSYLGMRVDIGDHLKACFDADPDMPMAWLTKGAFLMMFATEQMRAGAERAVAKVQALTGLTPREEAHLDALSTWIAGDMERACRVWEAILIDHPRDVMAFKLSQLNRFYLGVGRDMRDVAARLWYAWDEAVPGYGYIAGCYAFSLEEAGDYARAEPIGRHAVELQPDDIWAAHAVGHILEMQGRSAEGLAYLDGLVSNWGAIHNFVHHAHWHRALFALDMGDADRALEIFDRDVWTDRVEDYLDLSNGAALLWRLLEAGVDVGARWQDVGRLAADKSDDNGLVFADCHIALALANAAGDDAQRQAALGAFITATGDRSQGSGTQAQVMATVGHSLCEAVAADAHGDSDRVVALLSSVRHGLYRIGGSHAQRDLFERMLLSNALKSARIPLARALLSERMENRPKDSWGRQKQDNPLLA